EQQQQILQQYKLETKAKDTSEAIRILQENNWDLKSAIQNRYLPSGSHPRPSYASSETNSTSALLGDNASHPSAQKRLLSLFLWPMHITWRITWQLLQLTARVFHKPMISSQRADARSEADRFLREFESSFGTTHPHFFSEGGYTKALNAAKSQLKYMLAILSSEEHDDHHRFCKETLTNPELLEFLHQHQVIVWGGHVKYTEAYQVSHLLQATTYPFLAIIALQPSNDSQKMAVIDRIEGETNPTFIIRRLEQAMARVGPSLNQLRRQREQQEVERLLREEQERAYQESLRADQEKQERIQQEQQAAERAEKARQRRARNRQLHIQQLVHQVKDRQALVENEPAEDMTRVSFRLATGERVIQKFRANDPLVSLYQFIEAYPYLNQPSGSSELPEEDYVHEYNFTLHSPFPRTVYDPDPDRQIKDEKGLWPSATLIVDTMETE
ncbi:FAS-associated factor 2-B, partial [Choanephora cucurbitarum]